MSADLFEQARTLHHAGRFSDAATLYRQITEQDPGHFRAYNNLGACEDELQQWEQAELAFRNALAIAPDEAPIQHNLGRLLHKQGSHKEAEHHYFLAIQLQPDFADAYFNLGRLLQDTRQFEQSIAVLMKATELMPSVPGPNAVLGDVFFELGLLPQSLAAYRKVTDIAPTDAFAHFHLGKVLETLQRPDEAANSYSRSLAIEAASPAAREALARSLEAAGRHDAAVQSLRTWLELEPGQPVATHMLAALGAAETPDAASEGYVRETFDRFAGNFDTTLEKLQYQAPQLVQQAVFRHYGEAHADLQVLDAGCGTGLCGPLLRPYAASLTGMDLSPAMLKLADRLHVYDKLEEAELVAYLASQHQSFDLIAAADTFCYFGRLDTAFGAAAQALKPGACLVFTLELATQPADYVLGIHGRYAHSEDYVRASLEQAGLKKYRMEYGTLRNEGGVPVSGLIVTSCLTAG
ncbi:tetratricopeptide repeat protein [Undibacterium sp. TJN25]|uniref:tetratricopeptide repeat protein n=1 Tax=Undibacterium sp. TJN25 TaxID=3413056 RepID=UPI003BF121DD